MSKAAADNDILYKAAWYGLASELLSMLVPGGWSETLMLGEARFVVGRRLDRERKKGIAGADGAITRFRDILGKLSAAEPSSSEQSLAAILEDAAQEAGVELDTGESLLCAMTIHRDLHRLATGDKRAICALEVLARQRVELKKMAGKIVCLEQLFVRLMAKHDQARVRSAVCAATHVDKAVTACFSCSSLGTTPANWIAGLSSYVRAVRAEAPTLLDS